MSPQPLDIAVAGAELRASHDGSLRWSLMTGAGPVSLRVWAGADGACGGAVFAASTSFDPAVSAICRSLARAGISAASMSAPGGGAADETIPARIAATLEWLSARRPAPWVIGAAAEACASALEARVLSRVDAVLLLSPPEELSLAGLERLRGRPLLVAGPERCARGRAAARAAGHRGRFASFASASDDFAEVLPDLCGTATAFVREALGSPGCEQPGGRRRTEDTESGPLFEEPQRD